MSTDTDAETITDRGDIEERFGRLRAMILAGREPEALGELDQLRAEVRSLEE